MRLHRTAQKAIGAGILLANTMMSDYCFAVETIKELSSLAIFILAHVKKHVDSCSGSTHLVVVKGNADLSFSNDKDVKRIEEEIEEVVRQNTKDLKQQLTAKQLPDFVWFTRLRERVVPPIESIARTSKG